ncbi:hypothetical protein Leryth_026088 [Lithospermum erythrorhizon]|nr:hypothetical protein Leryth_026088 [Lithospermum erythrorhizon]
MAAIESALSIFGSIPSTHRKSCFNPKSFPSIRPHTFTSTPSIFSKPHFFTKKQSFLVQSTAEDVAVQELEQENSEQVQSVNQKRKLFVLNLPWTYTVVDIINLFGQCGTVSDVEIIKQKNGKSRGFAFITMATGEEAQAAIDKFDSSELLGRIIKVELAHKFKKPRPISSSLAPPRESRHKLYVSNLSWKARSTNLREFFSGFNPISARVVFDNPSGKSAGYGFVSFSTKEEAETAISSLDGKELMGRPIRLKFSEQNVEGKPESGSEDINEEHPAES